MDLKKAALWAQILSLPTGLYCAYAAWVTLQPRVQSTAGQMAAPAVSPAFFLVSLGAFGALVCLSLILWVVSRISRYLAIRTAIGDPLAEARKKKIRVTACGFLQKLYHGAGSQALGGVLQGANGYVRALRADSQDGIKALAADLLAESAQGMHASIDSLLSVRACDTDEQLQAILAAWDELFGRYQKLVASLARAQAALGLTQELRDPNYLQWRRHDAELIAGLKQIQFMEGCELFLPYLKEGGWGDEDRPKLPRLD